MSYIRFENIVKSFGSNTVLKDINLEVEKGQLVTLLGRPDVVRVHCFDVCPVLRQ